ncbi:MAG: hypothetical protein CMJ18_21850 [Phycisphaeraceae bacterium]|nr:hypothetical protein [Phycisphaeraceae bacterium]
MCPYRRSRKPLYGFTLIELLVVISIIALLIALLLPAIKRAKAVAMQVSCGSLLANVGVALYAYAGDQNGFFPRPTDNVGPSNVGRDAGRILEFDYGLGFPNGQTCPALLKSDDWNELHFGELPNWGYRLGYLAISSLQSGGHDAASFPAQVPYVSGTVEDPPGHNLGADFNFRVWRNWNFWDPGTGFGSIVPHQGNEEDGRPLGANNLFQDVSVTWMDESILGPDGEGIDGTFNYDYNPSVATLGDRSYYWGVALYR